MSLRSWWAAARLVAVAAAVALLVIGLRKSPLGERLSSIAEVRALVATLAPFDKPAFVLTYAVGALFLPGTVLSFAGALLFGVWWGTLLVWIGAVLGSLAPFGVARVAGRPAVDALLAGRRASLQRFDDWIARRGFAGLLLVRFLPIFPYWLVNYGCGFIGVRFRDFLAATAIGIIPGTFVYQYLFANLGETFLQEGFRWHHLRDPNLLAPLGVFLLFLVAGRWLARRLAQAPAEKTTSDPPGVPIKSRESCE